MSQTLDAARRRRLPIGLRRALARIRRRTPLAARGACRVQLIKRRPTRSATFYGRADVVGHVHWGIVVKCTSPARAAAQLARYQKLELAGLLDGAGLPRVPHVAVAHPADGWIAFEAWPGRSLSLESDALVRAMALARVAGLVVALEKLPADSWTGRTWSGAQEHRRLLEVWSLATSREAGDSGSRVSLPAWTSALADWLVRQEPQVPAHRDLYAEQVIVNRADDRCDCWIDWDQAALAPAGLDVGNMLAHERLAAAQANVMTPGARSSADPAVEAYLSAGGMASVAILNAWEATACLRLAGLILQRSRGFDPVDRSHLWVREPASSEPLGRGLVDEARMLWETAFTDSSRHAL